MKKKTNGKKMNEFRIIGSVYLLILAFQLFSRADTAENPIFGLICAGAFVVVGIGMLCLEWKQYHSGDGEAADPEGIRSRTDCLVEEEE